MSDHFAIEPCTPENRKTIVEGINTYNLNRVTALAPTWTPVEFVIKNEDEAIAGILGGIGYWNGLEINILWVNDNYRGQGIGTQLLQYTENFAIQKGATVAMLDTFDFQAEGFYIKNGYTVVGEINNFPEGHKRVYLSKRL